MPFWSFTKNSFICLLYSFFLIPYLIFSLYLSYFIYIFSRLSYFINISLKFMMIINEYFFREEVRVLFFTLSHLILVIAMYCTHLLFFIIFHYFLSNLHFFIILLSLFLSAGAAGVGKILKYCNYYAENINFSVYCNFRYGMIPY